MPCDDWGPLAGPWTRAGPHPLTASDGRPLSGQNGCQTVFQYRGRWRMLVQRYDGLQHTCLTGSDDGLRWDAPQPVLYPETEWEGEYALGNAVGICGGGVRLYYFGKRGTCERVGLATSTDLVEWRRHPGNPILSPPDVSLAVERVFPDSVVPCDDAHYLFYDAGFDYHHPTHPRAYTIRLAVGLDGMSFEDLGLLPALGPGGQGAWDDAWVCQAHVLRYGDWWYMLYVGMSRRGANKDGQAFGLARSRHPAEGWEKYPHNPVFTPAGGEAWDGRFLQHPCPVPYGDRWRLYYTGNGPEGYAVGLATGSPA